MPLHLIALGFPEWQPHFSFLDTPQANEMMALRWLHLIFGIIWIGLLYFFNLVLTPAMKKCDPKLRIKIYPELMPGAMGWFRWSALVTVFVGMRYYAIHLASDAKLAGNPKSRWKVVRLVVPRLARRLCFHLRPATPHEGNLE